MTMQMLLLLVTAAAILATVQSQSETNIDKHEKQNMICNLPMEKGPCKASMPRFYYEKNTKDCHWFVYGGCKGNANNFKTLQDCKATCNEIVMTSYYYN